MKKIIWIAVAVIILSVIISCCHSDDSNGYSNDYNTNSSYRKNINDAAGAYGVSPKEADDVAQALGKAMR